MLLNNNWLFLHTYINLTCGHLNVLLLFVDGVFLSFSVVHVLQYDLSSTGTTNTVTGDVIAWYLTIFFEESKLNESEVTSFPPDTQIFSWKMIKVTVSEGFKQSETWGNLQPPSHNDITASMTKLDRSLPSMHCLAISSVDLIPQSLQPVSCGSAFITWSNRGTAALFGSWQQEIHRE